MDNNDDLKNNDNYATKDQLNKLESDITTPDRFAKIFSDSIEKSKVLEKSIKNCLKDLITNDNEVKKSLIAGIDEYDKGKRKEFKSKIWTVLSTLGIFLFGSIVNWILNKF